MSKFKITVIGTINKDTLIFPDGKRKESFGGILYNLSALSALGGKAIEIYPVCNLGYDIYDEVKAILTRYKNVRWNGINKVKRKNNHAFLSIDKNNERKEILQNRVPVLNFDQASPFLDSQVLLVNFISGFDVGLTDLKRIRKHTNALIFMDIHSLTLGIDINGKRFKRTPPNWIEYIKQADIAQANLFELQALSREKVKSLREIRKFGSHILGLGPRAWLVTLGAKGAVVIYKEGEKVKFEKCAGINVREFKDATGCGDVFSAGFLTCYLNTKDLIQSLDFANHMAAEKCKISGVEGVANLLKKYSPLKYFGR